MNVFGEDILSAGLVLIIVWLVGARAVQSQPTLERRGQRLALLAFAGYFLYAGLTTRPDAAGSWLRIAIEALLIAGFTLGLSWIFFALLAFLHEHAVSRPRLALARWRSDARRRREERETGLESERRARIAQAEYERSAPERDQARLKMEAEATARSGARKRREDARAQCELEYSLHAPDIRERFSQAQFDEFLAKYMGDDRTPEEVEERSRQLQAIIQKHVDRTAPPAKLTTLGDLARWFAEQKKQIEALPIDQLRKDTHLSELNERYAELTSKLLERMEP